MSDVTRDTSSSTTSISNQNACPFQLIIRQQPVHSRMCGIVDRRPIDPPPVVQIKLMNTNHQEDDESRERLSALSTHLFLIAILVPADTREKQEPNILMHSKLTVGRTVSSLYNLRDLDGSEGAFFVFSDISVRTEGTYRLQMCLFDIEDQIVKYDTSILTDPFTVYSAKTFPGMYRSCELVQSFARQGLKIRIRKEAGPRPARCTQRQKDIRKATIDDNSSIHHNEEHMDTEEDEYDDTYSQNSSCSSQKRSSTGELTGQHCLNKRRLSLSYLLLDGEDDQRGNSVKNYITSYTSSSNNTSLITNGGMAAHPSYQNNSQATTTSRLLPAIQHFPDASPTPYHHNLTTGAFHHDKDDHNIKPSMRKKPDISMNHNAHAYNLTSTAYSRPPPLAPASQARPPPLLPTTITTNASKSDLPAPSSFNISASNNPPKLPSIQQLVHEKHD